MILFHIIKFFYCLPPQGIALLPASPYTVFEVIKMSFDKFEYILAVAEERNLTKAAQRLYISQPTLTLYLNRLEAELGAKLFDRSRSPILITAAGQLYIQKMKQIVNSERTLRNDIKLMSNPAQSLVVGIGQVRGSSWIPAILPEFCRLHPDVNIQVLQKSEETLYEGLLRQRIDLVIGAYPTAAPQLKIEELMFECVFLGASSKFGIIPKEVRDQYNQSNPYPAQPEQLVGLPFIIPGIGNGLYSLYENMVRENHLNPSRTIAVGGLSTGVRLAAAGLGIQLMSGPVVEFTTGIDSDSMDFFILKGMPSRRRCVALYAPDSPKQPLIEDFLRITREEVIPNLPNCEPA